MSLNSGMALDTDLFDPEYQPGGDEVDEAETERLAVKRLRDHTAAVKREKGAATATKKPKVEVKKKKPIIANVVEKSIVTMYKKNTFSSQSLPTKSSTGSFSSIAPPVEDDLAMLDDDDGLQQYVDLSDEEQNDEDDNIATHVSLDDVLFSNAASTTVANNNMSTDEKNFTSTSSSSSNSLLHLASPAISNNNASTTTSIANSHMLPMKKETVVAAVVSAQTCIARNSTEAGRPTTGFNNQNIAKPSHCPGDYKVLPETVQSDDALRVDTFLSAAAAAAGNNSSSTPTYMFWIDAREDTFSNPGTIYLFGKSWNPQQKQFHSCCTAVSGLMRTLFVLPRLRCKNDDSEVTQVKVVAEIGALLSKAGILKRRLKFVERYYAFEEEGIPRERTTWMKVRYEASDPPLGLSDNSQQKYNTFSHVFGDKRSFLEMFLLKRRLKGPCWLELKAAEVVPEGSKISWCTTEFKLASPKNVAPADPDIPSPSLTVMSINLCTILNPRLKVNEIAAVSCIVQEKVSMEGRVEGGTKVFTIVRRVGDMKAFPFDMKQVFDQKKCLSLPRTEQTEKSLLTSLMAEIEKADPDMYVGHNFIGYDLDVLLHRIEAFSIGNWSRIGRMKLKQMPRLQGGAGGTGESTWEERAVLHGRLVADTYLLAREYLKESSYKLLNLAVSQGLEGVSGAIAPEMVEEENFIDVVSEMQTAKGLFKIVHATDTKALLALALLSKMSAIPLTKRLTALAGNLWSKTLCGSRAERIEYLLMHKFYCQKYILPDKQKSSKFMIADPTDDQKASGQEHNKKSKFVGGKVLEPKRGLYTDFVLLLDFNSLYPSIIQEYNVCFTTVTRPQKLADGSFPDAPVPEAETLICDVCAADCSCAKKEKDEDTPVAPKLNIKKGESCRHRCILPKAIKELVDNRRQVKKLLKDEKDPAKREQLDIRQKALKLTANSIYGCLGFQSSRFYAQPLAQLITSKGREALSRTAELVPKIDASLDVIYGDTDSVMISTGITTDVPQVIKLANMLKREVNKFYRHLEIDIDGIFKSILLVKKKKYAALVLQDISKGDVPGNIKREVKGLDLVRRDWCPLSQSISKSVLDEILSGKPSDDILSGIQRILETVANNIRSNNVDLKEYIITKSLTKAPEQYADQNNQPHVLVALRLKAKKISVQTNDLVPYVICDPETIKNTSTASEIDKGKVAYRAFHPDEMHNDQNLKPDIDWYFGTQIHPPVARLCEHIQGMDSFFVAESLGLRTNRYIVHSAFQSSSSNSMQSSSVYHYSTATYDCNDEERFQDAEPLTFNCAFCPRSIGVSLKQKLCDKVTRYFGVLHEKPEELTLSQLLQCECGKYEVPIAKVFNTVLVRIREYQQRYYSTQQQQNSYQSGNGITSSVFSTHPPSGGMDDDFNFLRTINYYSEQRLRHQISYFFYLFDMDRLKEQTLNHLRTSMKDKLQQKTDSNRLNFIFDKVFPQETSETAKFLTETKNMIGGKLRSCKRHHINIGTLFQQM